jgi:demethylmenaquinone methyltransferase/2-methoxy-6-polyprenyl-1,4-benzoquinol methylase
MTKDWNAEALGNSRTLGLFFRPAGAMMGSRLRRWLRDPVKTLQGADIQPGQSVLEVGCGTGFFTIPAARLIGDRGCLVAMDVSSAFIERVFEKVRAAELQNVRVVKRDALNTGLDAGSMDTALLFGVVPFPLLPLNRLLPEMHRVLKPKGRLAAWLFPFPGWVPRAIVQSGLSEFVGKRNGVHNYRRR